MNPTIPQIKTAEITKFKRVDTKKVERIDIQPDYRDYFLGKLYRKKKKIKPVKKTVTPPVIFPPINFIGIIEGTTTSYIIQINGRQEIFKKGQTFQGITLKRVKNKSIIIKYKGASKTILRTQ